jgi:gliding motility-associated-like protein
LADSGKFVIALYPNPKISLTDPPKVCTDSAVTLNVGSHPGMAIKWTSNNPNMTQPDTSQTVYIKLPQAMQGSDQYFIYTVTITNKCGVDTSASANVHFINCNITIPNVFTPNGDGINDYLYIDRIDSVSYLQWQVIIFNRWGRKVWETEDYKNGDPNRSWNGEGAPEGVYYYVVRNFKKNLTYTGYVQLIR